MNAFGGRPDRADDRNGDHGFIGLESQLAHKIDQQIRDIVGRNLSEIMINRAENPDGEKLDDVHHGHDKRDDGNQKKKSSLCCKNSNFFVNDFVD